MWVLRHSTCCTLGDLAVLFEFTNAVSSKFVLVIRIVYNVQAFELELIYLDDLFIAKLVHHLIVILKRDCDV